MPGFERLGSESWKEVAEPWPWQDPGDTGAPEAKLSCKAQKRETHRFGVRFGVPYILRAT